MISISKISVTLQSMMLSKSFINRRSRNTIVFSAL
ncbi:MAG: hypothetical protein A4E28_01231 [Methanocella sp. PtaU1.Bin125]|nr:MAG: hypothetical protein A4E28_01231 [Methanocella sp. PtaU1.Bin125]